MRKRLGIITTTVVATTGIIARALRKKAEKDSFSANLMEPVEIRELGFYEKYVKRGIDVVCAAGAIVCFCPLYLGVAALVKIKLGSPVLFVQYRPGVINNDGKETIFKMYKFRTMTDEKDERGELLPDEVRLTKFGSWLRTTSLDELPEAFNILNGTMSVIGPRPQLVRDLTFMSKNQRRRHTAKPGLSGLAQINGRNDIDWNTKLELDLQYLKNVSFYNDFKIVLKTISKAFIQHEGITEEGMATAEDYCDYLLARNLVDKSTYDEKRLEANKILDREDSRSLDENLVSIIMPSYNSEKYIEKTIKSVLDQSYNNWELIIVDDCSTDNTVNIIQAIKDNRIRLFTNEYNSGAAISRNRALKEARGRWIAFLDSDDIWMPEKIQEQLSYMKENNLAFTYTDYMIQLNGKWLPYIYTAPNKINKRKMYNYCYFSTITVMYDQKKVGLIQIPDLKKNNDYAMWLKAIERVDCYRFPKCLSFYIKHEGSVSSGKKVKLIKWHYLLFRKGLNKKPASAVLLTANNIIHGVVKKMWYKRKISAVPSQIY